MYTRYSYVSMCACVSVSVCVAVAVCVCVRWVSVYRTHTICIYTILIIFIHMGHVI